MIVVLFCLMPKAENDLFFQLRTGTDILNRGAVPHVDTYSWINRGTPWDVPEWLSFVLYTLAFQAGSFLGVCLLMIVLTLSAMMVVWWWLVRRVAITWAFLLINLTLLAISDYVQERPYGFTYLLLPIALIVLQRARVAAGTAHVRGSAWRCATWLAMLCIVWTNLHQGVLAFIGLVLAYAAADGSTACRLRIREVRRARANLLAAPDFVVRARRSEDWRLHLARARVMAAIFLGCACASLVSPYGWRIYRNVLITMRDPTLMSSVTEWKPAWTVPFGQLEAFAVMVLIIFGGLFLSCRRNAADIVAAAALFCQAMAHARGIPLFVIAGIVIAGPNLGRIVRRRQVRNHVAEAKGQRTAELQASMSRRAAVLACLAALYTVAIGLVEAVQLHRTVGPAGYSAEGIGEAVAREPSYPSAACAFVDAERFPANLRILNNFEIGGYLIWMLPREPVFIDGRLDVYVGKTFDHMMVLAQTDPSPRWGRLMRQYDFDCVITTTPREVRDFAHATGWQLVYCDPRRPHHMRCRIYLRRRPRFAGLIARCLRDRPLATTP